jgi:hypothetical protein
MNPKKTKKACQKQAFFVKTIIGCVTRGISVDWSSG